MTEKDYVYEIETERVFYDQNSVVKPYVYQNLFLQVVDRHLKNIGLTFEMTAKHDLAWVLVSMSFEIQKPMYGIAKLYANTWYSQRRGPFFRREVVFKNEAGETVFHGSTFSVLLNLKSRTVSRQVELPFDFMEPVKEFTVEAGPVYKNSAPYVKIDERKIYNSFIDFLGHVNNRRYGEFAYDALDGGELLRLKTLKRIDIYFVSELKNNEILAVYKACEGNKILVRGLNGQNSVSFDYVMAFDE